MIFGCKGCKTTGIIWQRLAGDGPDGPLDDGEIHTIRHQACAGAGYMKRTPAGDIPARGHREIRDTRD